MIRAVSRTLRRAWRRGPISTVLRTAINALKRFEGHWASWLGAELWRFEDWRIVRRERTRLGKAAAQGGPALIEALGDRYRRRSDTVFILGSGASIGDMTPEDFAEIAKHDSIAFNFWAVHSFVPSIYFIEGISPRPRYECFLELMRKRAAAYRDTPLVVEWKLWSARGNRIADLPPDIRHNAVYNVPWYMPVSSARQARTRLGAWLRRYATRGERLSNLVHHRATISTLIMFAWAMGWRRIVLCGVDLNDTRYFWEVRPEAYEEPFPPNVETGSIHMTVDPSRTQKVYALAIDDWIRLLEQDVLRPDGVDLLVANPRSRLAEFLPVWDRRQRP